MEIYKRFGTDVIELTVKGRLDGYWADHLASALEGEIREGSHHILLDLSEVAFLSSAGIGILVKFYKQLKNIQGSLAVSKSSKQVRKILEISGLKEVLSSVDLPGADDLARAKVVLNNPAVLGSSVSQSATQIETLGAVFNVYTLSPGSTLKCHSLGDVGLLRQSRFKKENCRTVEFPDFRFGIGLGALGEHFEDCQGRFGELLAAAGAVAYLPTDGTNIADYVVAAGNSTPEAQICYGIICQGSTPQPFSHLVRFEATKEAGSVRIDEISEALIKIAATARLGVVMVAEAAGLVGAALRRSPAQPASESARFQFPEIRDWLTFTGDRAYNRCMALVVGVALAGDAGELAPMVRSLDHAGANATRPMTGHFHAAAFSYRPLQKGKIDLTRTVKGLFEEQALQGVLHLLSEYRTIGGAGQSEFVRGACWIGPIDEILPEGNPR
jgi:anti-anti-sigma factor